MIDYPKARVSTRNRKKILCSRTTNGGEPCGGHLGWLVSAAFQPLGTAPTGETGWINDNDRDGCYIRLSNYAQGRYDRGETPRPRRSFMDAGGDLMEHPEEYAGAQERYHDPVRVRCPDCKGHVIVQPEELAE